MRPWRSPSPVTEIRGRRRWPPPRATSSLRSCRSFSEEEPMEVTIDAVSSIPPGEGRTFEVGSLRIAVFHTRHGEVFATQAECPHRGGPLADGLLGGSTLV